MKFLVKNQQPSGGLNVTAILPGGEGAVGPVPAGAILFGSGRVSAQMLQDELIVIQGTACAVNTTVYPDGTGHARVVVSDANSSFADAGDFLGSLIATNKGTATISGRFTDALNLDSGGYRIMRGPRRPEGMISRNMIGRWDNGRPI
jgi:hypothetical protein